MDVRKACLKFYWKAKAIIAPSLRYSQQLYEDVLFAHSGGVENWLDLGSGHQLLPPWRIEHERFLAARPRLFVGLDYDLQSLKKHGSIRLLVRGDISRLPFPNDTYDLVTANMVFEHLRDPEDQLKEVFRVLRPGGALIFHTPNSLGYGAISARLIPESLRARIVWWLQERREEDIFPTYYRINTPTAIQDLADKAGFELAKLHLLVSSAAFVMIPPVALLELILLRLLMTRWLRRFRTNIIAVLKKPARNEMLASR